MLINLVHVGTWSVAFEENYTFKNGRSLGTDLRHTLLEKLGDPTQLQNFYTQSLTLALIVFSVTYPFAIDRYFSQENERTPKDIPIALIP